MTTEWEVLAIAVKRVEPSGELDLSEVNSLSAAGWEVVGFVPLLTPDERGYYSTRVGDAILKRPVQ